MSTKDTAKKERELWQLNVFKKTFPEFPHDKVVSGEAPDFAVGTVAIELTEILIDSHKKGASPKAAEGREDKVMQRLGSLCKSCGLPPLNITLHFGRHEARSFDVEVLARELCNLIGKHMPPEEGRIFLNGNEVSLPDEISAMSIGRFSFLKKLTIAPVRAGFVAHLEPALVQKAISSKEGKVRGNFSQRWLLIVLEAFAPSSFWEIGEEARGQRYSTGFDRIFVLDCFDGRYVELRTVAL